MTLALDSVSHYYRLGHLVVDDVTLSIDSGESIALMGPSGSGKTTLLSILGLLTIPSYGTVRLDGRELLQRRDDLNRHRGLFAWVFQTANVLNYRTVLDNAALGLLAHGLARRQADARAYDVLESVGLADRARDPVVDLSGGEVQRVCIARAVAVAPRFILADEPTGQLDGQTSVRVLTPFGQHLVPGRR